jgi:Domain of unknown function (DUF5666)
MSTGLQRKDRRICKAGKFMNLTIKHKRLGGSAMVLLAAITVSLTGTVWAQENVGGRGEGRGAGGAAFAAGGQMVRGTVTAAAADHLTVKTDAGEVYQVTVSANTRIMKDRQPVKLTDVKVGDGAGAMGELDAPTKTVHALFVTVMDAEQVKKLREGLGKVYIVGKVTAIDDVKLTVLRNDGVSQVIEVDEGTSFKRGGRQMASMLNGSGPVGNVGGGGRAAGAGSGSGSGSGSGGESITLADVKVGDMVAGQGALKNGVFVPTELGVMDAAAMTRRRRSAEGGGAASAGAGVSGNASPAGSAPASVPTPTPTPKQD